MHSPLGLAKSKDFLWLINHETVFLIRKEELNCKRIWTVPLGKQLTEAGAE